jgi:hypothetical protein
MVVLTRKDTIRSMNPVISISTKMCGISGSFFDMGFVIDFTVSGEDITG